MNFEAWEGLENNAVTICVMSHIRGDWIANAPERLDFII